MLKFLAGEEQLSRDTFRTPKSKERIAPELSPSIIKVSKKTRLLEYFACKKNSDRTYNTVYKGKGIASASMSASSLTTHDSGSVRPSRARG